MIRINANRKTKTQPTSLSNTTPRIKASTQSISIVRIQNQSIICFALGLDVLDQNIPGFGDDLLGNDIDGDTHSLTKSKLNINTNKDKKKNFFKKVLALI